VKHGVSIGATCSRSYTSKRPFPTIELNYRLTEISTVAVYDLPSFITYGYIKY
jgi:hypothetical protein